MKSLSITNVFLAMLMFSSSVWAINPSLGTIMPRGGQRGTDIEVSFTGGKLADAVEIFFHDPGITLKEIKEVKDGNVNCVLTIAPDCRLGPHRMRVRTKTGITNLALFSVGNLTEIKEAEPNNTLVAPQVIALNTTVNGVITSEDVDYFSVDLPANSRLSVEIEALRLGRALFDAKVRLFDPAGRQLIAEDDTALMEQDAAFVFVNKEAGIHTVVLSEATYGGSGAYDYRAHIGTFPRPLSVTPMGLQQGQTAEVTWLGDPGIQKQSITMADAKLGMHSVLPANELGVAPTEVPFRVTNYPGVLEVEPNNEVSEATVGTAPGAFDGVIQTAGDIDRYSFEGKKGQVFVARVWARAMGSPLDSVMTIKAPSGTNVMSNDDAAGLDSSQRITLPEDGIYTMEVRDHLSQGGSVFAYRIELAPVEPLLKVQSAHNDPISAVLSQGNRAVLYLQATRNDFGGDINVELLNLPAGVTATHGVIPNGQTMLPILLTATADAALAGSKIEAKCTSLVGETTIEGGFVEDLAVVRGRNKIVILATEINGVAMAVTEKAPYSLDFVVPKTPGIRGANKGLKVVVTRDEGFTAEIKVRVPQYPSGINGGTLTIPEGQSEGVFNIEINGGAPLGETQLIAVGESAGYQLATNILNFTVSEPWVQFATEELRLEQGTEATLAVKVTDVQEYAGEYELELYRLPKGVTSVKQPIKHGMTEVVFPLTVAKDAPAGKHGNLGFLLNIMVDGEPVNHRAVASKITLFEPLPPTVKKEEPKPTPEAAKKDEPPKPERRTRFPETAQ